MDTFIVLLIVALVTSNIFACWIIFRWRAIARLNRVELEHLTNHLTKHARESYDKGYARGLKDGVVTMNQYATQAGASEIVLTALHVRGLRLLGTTDDATSEPPDVDYAPVGWPDS